jgi:hypothetical protein
MDSVNGRKEARRVDVCLEDGQGGASEGGTRACLGRGGGHALTLAAVQVSVTTTPQLRPGNGEAEGLDRRAAQ